jgi:hypothetical protein
LQPLPSLSVVVRDDGFSRFGIMTIFGRVVSPHHVSHGVISSHDRLEVATFATKRCAPPITVAWFIVCMNLIEFDPVLDGIQTALVQL